GGAGGAGTGRGGRAGDRRVPAGSGRGHRARFGDDQRGVGGGMTLPWAPGSATGIGSLPGTDIVEALRVVFGELPLPYLPELPARGPGAELIGRSAGLLVDLPVQLYAGRWQVAAHPGADTRRTADLWERDLDALTAQADGYAGPLKIQA